MCRRFSEAGILRSALAGFVLAGLMLALLMSASPELHKGLHHDADQGQHECLATMLGSGGCDNAPVVTLVSQFLPQAQLMLLPTDGVAAVSFFLKCSIFEHAPPAFS